MTATEATDVLRATHCQCGHRKSYGHAVCGRCYWALPADLKRDLYLRVGHGFEAHYQRALGLLKARRSLSAAGGA